MIDPAGSPPGRDLAPQRRERLSLIVESRRAVRLEELSAALGVSVATVRRDLDELARSGRLHRVHGGAVAVDRRPGEPHFEVKATEAVAEKERIAARAIELLAPDDAVYLDSGSTVLAVARLLRGWSRLTVVTNSLPAASELAGQGPRLIVIGGEVRATSRALVGPLTRLVLDRIHVDRALMGTFALSLEEGLTTTDPTEAFTKELVLARAGEVILLADSRKMGTRSLVHAGRLGDIDVLVTDDGIDDRLVRGLERRGVKVIKA
ncbi:MAG: DeoR/GlpR family DNA-binding transcription regulator [Chloroflexi bacterium]|nr:DeoR/GlpR family DNA-binding transcription regulator [Chloroflexota bacterium]